MNCDYITDTRIYDIVITEEKDQIFEVEKGLNVDCWLSIRANPSCGATFILPKLKL